VGRADSEDWMNDHFIMCEFNIVDWVPLGHGKRGVMLGVTGMEGEADNIREE